MKPWTKREWNEEDLILFYYDELEASVARQLRDDLGKSKELQAQYNALCRVLDGALKVDVPQPSNDLNQRIMAGIEEHRAGSRRAQSNSVPRLWHKLIASLEFKPRSNFAVASLLALFAVMGTFYLGRLSVEPIAPSITETTPPHLEERGFDSEASRRILLTNVSSHLETSQRLLRRVSNSGDDPTLEVDSRQKMIEELIVYNRLYRRLAEQSDDKILASVLQQMETILLEISHSAGDDDRRMKNIRERLNNSDLLFKLKVTDQKISREII